MKELSIEEKAKAYDEVRKKITIRFGSNVADEIFSQFEMSEDERIRKALIYHYQGDGCICSNEYRIDYKNIRAWLEKQGEQKSADKVEPKFKVSDWVVYEENIYQIHNISLKKYYECLRTDGTVHTFDFEYIDSKSHLWTIEDAKDGDVLAVEPIEENYQYPFVAIFKERGLDFFNSYCFIGFDGKFYKGENGHSTEKVHPATKEQREQLEKAMADVGYTFDFEKKELKKIEQKPAWSEEDNYYYGIIQYILNNECVGKADKENAINWLKFLKERYTWKPSDEQMDALKEVCDKHWEPDGLDPLYTLYQDLKKLREE